MEEKTRGESVDPVTTVKAHPMHYGSVPSMFGKPISESPNELTDYDIAYLGIPWSAPPSAGRSASIAQFAGTTLTPNSMRTNSIKYGGYLPELDVDVFEHFRFTDYGNVDILFDVKESWINVERKVTDIVAAKCMAFTVGGNGGGASFPVLKAIAEGTTGRVAVVNFDAHGDNYIETAEERFSKRNPRWGSSWARRILDDIPNVDPKLYTHVGLRGPRNDSGVKRRFYDLGVPRENILTYADVKASRRGTLEEFGQSIARRTAGADKVWIAVDPDVLDMSVSPQFGDEPLGISVDELVHVAYEVGRAAGRQRFAGIAFMATPYEAHTIQWIEIYAALYAFAGVIAAPSTGAA